MTKAADCIREVKEHSFTCLIHTETGIATLFGSTGCNITRYQVTEGGITALEIIITVLLRNLGSFYLMFAKFLHILQLLWHPDAAIIAQTFTHQSQFTLLISMYRNTGRMYLCETGICKVSTLAPALHSSGTVAVHSISGKKISISISTGSNNHRMCAKSLELAGNQVAGNNTLRFPVYNHQIQHLVTGITRNCAGGYFFIQRCICTQKQLLSGLSAGIESTAYLNSTKGTVGKISTIFTGKRNTLSNTLIYNGSTYFCKTVNICLTCTVISTFYSIIKKPIDGVIIVLIILCCVYTSLSSN